MLHTMYNSCEYCTRLHCVDTESGDVIISATLSTVYLMHTNAYFYLT